MRHTMFMLDKAIGTVGDDEKPTVVFVTERNDYSGERWITHFPYLLTYYSNDKKERSIYSSERTNAFFRPVKARRNDEIVKVGEEIDEDLFAHVINDGVEIGEAIHLNKPRA